MDENNTESQNHTFKYPQKLVLSIFENKNFENCFLTIQAK